jgi:hypothetical protein
VKTASPQNVCKALQELSVFATLSTGSSLHQLIAKKIDVICMIATFAHLIFWFGELLIAFDEK